MTGNVTYGSGKAVHLTVRNRGGASLCGAWKRAEENRTEKFVSQDEATCKTCLKARENGSQEQGWTPEALAAEIDTQEDNKMTRTELIELAQSARQGDAKSMRTFRALALKAGYVGGSGGWIYAPGRKYSLCQGWQAFAKVVATSKDYTDRVLAAAQN